MLARRHEIDGWYVNFSKIQKIEKVLFHAIKTMTIMFTMTRTVYFSKVQFF